MHTDTKWLVLEKKLEVWFLSKNIAVDDTERGEVDLQVDELPRRQAGDTCKRIHDVFQPVGQR